MAGNTFGTVFKVTTFGESHGKAIGTVIDGVPPGIPLSVEEDIQPQMERRRPGQSAVSTPRCEEDSVEILSGLFEGVTTGTALALVICNRDMKSVDYSDIKDKIRPGHADYTYMKKYGIRDWRGGGRASGRETAARVAAGAVARKILASKGVSFTAYTVKIAGLSCRQFVPDYIEKNPLRICDPDSFDKMIKAVTEAKRRGDSVGGIVECLIRGVPAGLGEPVFDKLDALLASAMLSLGGVKGFEIGCGFKAADKRGSENNDLITPDGFLSNHAGGVLGGISSGQDILFRVAVKPPPSINRPCSTVTANNEPTNLVTEGRHDPTICPRIVPVVEAMAALVIVDLWLRGSRSLPTL